MEKINLGWVIEQAISINAPKAKFVLCVESMRHRLGCDLLLPRYDSQPVPRLIESTA